MHSAVCRMRLVFYLARLASYGGLQSLHDSLMLQHGGRDFPDRVQCTWRSVNQFRNLLIRIPRCLLVCTVRIFLCCHKSRLGAPFRIRADFPCCIYWLIFLFCPSCQFCLFQQLICHTLCNCIQKYLQGICTFLFTCHPVCIFGTYGRCICIRIKRLPTCK